MRTVLFKYRLKMMLGAFKGGGRIGRNLLFLAALAMFAFVISSFAYGLYKFAQHDPVTGAQVLHNLVALAFNGIFFFLLFWGLSQAVFTIFFSDDLGLLLSLPIPRRDIFAYKVTEATLLNTRLSFLFLMPMLVILGMFHGSGIVYYIIAVMVTLLMASVPGAIGIIIASLVSRKIPRTRLKGIITVVGSLLGVTLWALFNQMDKQYFSRSGDFGNEIIQATRNGSSPFFNYLPSGWAYKATIGAASGDFTGALLYLAILISISAALIVFAFTLTAKYYSGGVSEEIAASPRTAVGGLTFGNSPLMAHIRRDLILFVRESGVMTQSLVMAAFLLLYPFVGTRSGTDEIPGLAISPISILLAAFLGGQVGSRMLTLERLAFWRNLVIPFGRQMCLASKMVVGLVFTTSIALAAGLVHFAAGKPGDIDSIFLTVIFSWIGFAIGLVTGAYWGKFNWDHPKRMLRGGGGFVFAVLMIVVGMGSYGLTYLAYRYLSNIANPIIIVAVLSLGILSISYIVSAIKLLNMEWTPDV
jgi:ABC-2 type transport system permease protein